MGLDNRNETEAAKRLEQIECKLDRLAFAWSMESGAQSDLNPVLRSKRDEINLLEIWGLFWSGKWIIFGVTFIFALVSLMFALSLPNKYMSQALLAPAEENSGGGLAGLAGQFGGLASLAGVNLGGGGDGKTILAIEVIKSREFISNFIDRHKLKIPLIASVGWDRHQDELTIDPDIYDIQSKQWVRKPKPNGGREPSAQEAYKRFVRLLTVTQDQTTGFVTIGIEFYSPVMAKEWVDLLVEDINAEIKNRDVSNAEKSIKYLNEQLQRTSVANMQTIFFELIEEQSKIIMFANVREEYVFKTIDRAIVPEKKSKPSKALICIIGTFLGGIIGVAVVFIRSVLRGGNQA